MADLDAAPDEQDHSEVFDEENTNDADRRGGEDAEQFEDLVDVYDATSAVGDADDDDAAIGDDLEDEEIVALAAEEDDDEGEPDEIDGIDAGDPDEVELDYVGDLNDLAGAASAAQSLEAETLSDDDLRELDYKDGSTVDEGDANATA